MKNFINNNNRLRSKQQGNNSGILQIHVHTPFTSPFTAKISDTSKDMINFFFRAVRFE